MKKLCLFILCFLSMTAVNSQKKAKYESVGESKTLYGVYTVLTKEQTYFPEYPKNLMYWNSEKLTKLSSPPVLGGGIDAKYALEADADYRFTFITPGIQNENYGYPISYGVIGKIVGFKVYFPCSLQVSDKAGNLLKTFVLDDGEKEKIYWVHPNFLNVPEFTSRSLEIPITTAFTQSDERIMELIEKQEADYFTRIEYIVMSDYLQVAQNIIMMGYGKFKYIKPSMYFLDKSEKALYPELDAQIEKLSAAVAEVGIKQVDEDLQKRLLTLGEYFEANCPPDAPKKVKTNLFGYNSALAYMLGGDTERAYKVCVNNECWWDYLATMYEYLDYSNQLRVGKDADTLYITKAFSSMKNRYDAERRAEKDAKERAEYEAKRAEIIAAYQDLVGRNIDKQEGFLVTKTGDTIKGKISIDFIVPRSNMIDLDKGKIVWVDKKVYRSKNINRFVVDSRVIIPLGIDLDAVSKLIDFAVDGKLPKSAGSLVFLERVYQNGDYSAFYNPAYFNRADLNDKPLYVRIKDNDKVKVYSVMLEGKKETTAFLQSCKCESLLENIKAKEFANNIDGVKKFIDALANCNK